MKNFQLFILLGVLFTSLLFTGCSTSSQTNEGADEKNGLYVVATFYPVYDLTKSIVGDKATMHSIVPTGVEPHDYVPTPSDFQKLQEADAFVTLGVEFEAFEKQLADSAAEHVVEISAGKEIALLEFSESAEHHDEDEHEEHESEHESEHEAGDEHKDSDEDHHDADDHAEEEAKDHHDHHDDHHHHEGVDPHIWLSPRNAQKMVLNIMDGLVLVDPENSDYYLQSSQDLLDELIALDEAFTSRLANCNKDIVLVNHNAFSYLARDYGFSTIAVGGLEPEVEPTPKQLAELVEAAKEHNLKYVFYEELVDPRVANTIAQEVGAEVLALSPVASDFSVSYVALMEKNLVNLEVALECQ